MTGGRNINAIPIGVAGGSDRTAREGHSTAIHQGTRRQGRAARSAEGLEECIVTNLGNGIHGYRLHEVYGTNEVRLDFIPCFFCHKMVSIMGYSQGLKKL